MIMIIPSTLNECGDFFQLENLRKRMKKYGDITQNARDADEIDDDQKGNLLTLRAQHNQLTVEVAPACPSLLGRRRA